MNKDKQDDVGEPIVQGVVTATRVFTDVDKQVEALLAGPGEGDATFLRLKSLKTEMFS